MRWQLEDSAGVLRWLLMSMCVVLLLLLLLSAAARSKVAVIDPFETLALVLQPLLEALVSMMASVELPGFNFWLFALLRCRRSHLFVL